VNGRITEVGGSCTKKKNMFGSTGKGKESQSVTARGKTKTPERVTEMGARQAMPSTIRREVQGASAKSG